LQTFQDKLGSQAAFHSGISAHLDRIEANYTVHVANEKSLLKSFVQKMFLRFDYDHLDQSGGFCHDFGGIRDDFFEKSRNYSLCITGGGRINPASRLVYGSKSHFGTLIRDDIFSHLAHWHRFPESLYFSIGLIAWWNNFLLELQEISPTE
jgi:hypothetical protein